MLIAKLDPTTELKIKIKQSTMQNVDQYMAYYESIFNEEGSVDHIVEQLIVHAMDKDKGFRTFIKAVQEPQA